MKVCRAPLFKVHLITFLIPCPSFAWPGSPFQSDMPQKRLPHRLPQIARGLIQTQTLIHRLLVLQIMYRHQTQSPMNPNRVRRVWRNYRQYSCLTWDGHGNRQTQLWGPELRRPVYYRGQEDILQHRQNHGCLFSRFHSKVDSLKRHVSASGTADGNWLIFL